MHTELATSVSLAFPKSSRLLKSHEFRKIKREGRRVTGKWLVLHFSRDESVEGPKLGITVTKRFGKANKRNRFKRLIREIFRMERHRLDPCLVIHIYPKEGESLKSFADLRGDFLAILATP